MLDIKEEKSDIVIKPSKIGRTKTHKNEEERIKALRESKKKWRDKKRDEKNKSKEEDKTVEKESKNEKPKEDKNDKEEEESEDIDKLKEQCYNLYKYDVEQLKKNSSDEIREFINGMDEEELRIKIADKKMFMSAKLNDSLTTSVIIGANKLVGKVFKCTEQLNESTTQDKNLIEGIGSLMDLYCLSYVPLGVKLAVLYGSHAVCAVQKANMDNKIQNVIEIPPIEQPIIKHPEEIKEQNKDNVTFGSIR